MSNYVGVPSTDTAALRAASPAWVLDATVAPLFLVDSVGDTIPAAQLDDMVAQLNATGVTNYEARSIPGDLHSFAYWSQVKNDALAFLAAGFASPPPTPTPTPSPTVSPSPTATPTPGADGQYVAQHFAPAPLPGPGKMCSSAVSFSGKAMVQNA